MRCNLGTSINRVRPIRRQPALPIRPHSEELRQKRRLYLSSFMSLLLFVLLSVSYSFKSILLLLLFRPVRAPPFAAFADGIYGGRFLEGALLRSRSGWTTPHPWRIAETGRLHGLGTSEVFPKGEAGDLLDLSQNAWLKALLLEILFMLHDIHVLLRTIGFFSAWGGGEAVLVPCFYD